MAKQKSIIKLEGTIGDISFYKSKDGYLAREYAPVSAERIATDPTFQRTRENGAEFGRAGKAAKTLRRALREMILQGKDNRMVGRLTKHMVKVLQADQVSIRGLRNVLDGELELLRGFNFNINSLVDTVLFIEPEIQIDRVSGACSLGFPIFSPGSGLKAPAGSTHFEVSVCGSAVDFEQDTFESVITRSGFLSTSEALTAPLQLQVQLSPNTTRPIFLALGICFFQQVNGVQYPLSNGSYNALALAEINGV